MANASTVRRQVGGTQQLTIAPLLGSVIGTTATAFQLNNNGLTLTGGGVIPLSAGVTGLYAGTGQVLHVAFTGSIVAGADDDLTLTLYQVPASLLPIADTLAGAQTFTNWNSVAASQSIAIDGAKTSWSFDARLQLSSNGRLTGSFAVEINGVEAASSTTADAWIATTIVTGLVGEADLNFVMVATATASSSSNYSTFIPEEFRLDLE